MYRTVLVVECQHAVYVANIERANGTFPTVYLFAEESNLISIRKDEAVLGAITGVQRSQSSQALGYCQTHLGTVQVGQALSAIAMV